MAIVVPTVLATSPSQYNTMLVRAEGLSRRVHVDVCDGEFADTTTIDLAQVHAAESTELDLHLMLQDPVAQIETALSLRPRLIIFHVEATGPVLAGMQQVKTLGIKAGVALLPQTSVAAVRPLIEVADQVLIFTGTLGHNGGEFKADQLNRIAEVKAVNPAAEIGIDGGVTDVNASLAASHGVDVLYVGSFLQSAPDPLAALQTLNSQIGVAA